jgi:hypothetical protein
MSEGWPLKPKLRLNGAGWPTLFLDWMQLPATQAIIGLFDRLKAGFGWAAPVVILLRESRQA